MENYVELMKQAQKDGNIKELTALYKKWEKKGDKIVGAYIDKVSVTSSLNNQQYNQYLFQTDEGVIKFHLGKSGDSEIGAQFSEGCIYCIEFLGKEQISGGRSVNKYKCFEIGVRGEVVGSGVKIG